VNFKTKPVIAGVAAGAVLAAGGIAAIDLSSESAEAQSGGVSAADLKAANQRSQAAIRKANTLQNVAGKYFYPAGQQVGVNQPPGVIRPQPGTGTGGLPLSTLSEGLQNLQIYSAQYNWNGGAPQQAGRGLSGVQRVAAGTYNFQWPINVSQCVVTATPAYYAGANPGMGDNVQVYQVPGQPNWWQVRYYTTTPWTSAASPGGIALADGPVSVYVQCGNDTTSSN
jgi:hypothetical protein